MLAGSVELVEEMESRSTIGPDFGVETSKAQVLEHLVVNLVAELYWEIEEGYATVFNVRHPIRHVISWGFDYNGEVLIWRGTGVVWKVKCEIACCLFNG
jgi:hypothetical protein